MLYNKPSFGLRRSLTNNLKVCLMLVDHISLYFAIISRPFNNDHLLLLRNPCLCPNIACSEAKLNAATYLARLIEIEIFSPNIQKCNIQKYDRSKYTMFVTLKLQDAKSHTQWFH